MAATLAFAEDFGFGLALASGTFLSFSKKGFADVLAIAVLLFRFRISHIVLQGLAWLVHITLVLALGSSIGVSVVSG